jgi:hypothetical protein
MLMRRLVVSSVASGHCMIKKHLRICQLKLRGKRSSFLPPHPQPSSSGPSKLFASFETCSSCIRHYASSFGSWICAKPSHPKRPSTPKYWPLLLVPHAEECSSTFWGTIEPEYRAEVATLLAVNRSVSHGFRIPTPTPTEVVSSQAVARARSVRDESVSLVGQGEVGSDDEIPSDGECE